MTTSVTRSCFTKQHQNCKTKTKTTACKTKTKCDFFWSQTGLVLRPTVSDHITADNGGNLWAVGAPPRIPARELTALPQTS